MAWSKRILFAVCCIAVLGLEGNLPVVAFEMAAQRGEKSKVAPLGIPKTAFADSDLALRFACQAESSVPWQGSAARRPFASGVVAAKDGQVEIHLRTPEVKDGVVLPIQVAVEDALCKILVFPRDPLAGRRQWAEQLKLVLFDPLGNTADAFDNITLPYQRSTGLGALATVTEGVVVVGAGLPLAEHSGLDRVLFRLARQGVPVVLLAPESGSLTVCDPPPSRFELRDAHAGQQIDPHTASDLKQTFGYRISGERNGPVLQVTDDPSAYTWGDFRFGGTRGRLCCIGWNLLDEWETSPAPRFFFVHLLEIVSSGKDLPGVKSNE